MADTFYQQILKRQCPSCGCESCHCTADDKVKALAARVVDLEAQLREFKTMVTRNLSAIGN